jgi:hypothetical protein
MEGPEKLYPAARIVKSEERGHEGAAVRGEVVSRGEGNCSVEDVTELTFSRILSSTADAEKGGEHRERRGIGIHEQAI